MTTSIERQTMKKVYLRLLPFCFVLYFICYLDRVNIGFAALTMNKDLGLSSYVFGLGAGAFFWGYFILEVPSNLILDRVGARRWIARIMVTWGLVSGAFAFINGPIIAGWRWLFLCEAAPAVIFGIATFFYLTDRPAQADWLEAEEREWLATEMEKERKTVETGRTISVLQSLFNPRVLALAAIHFGQAGVSVGIAVFAAQIIKQLGLTNMQTGFTVAIPYVLGTIGMIVWGSYSDRKNERRWNLTASCTTMAAGCLIAGLLDNSYWAVVGLSLATIGLYASNAHLFPLPAVFLTGPALASGIAWVNSVGILGGSASPPIVGWFKDATGSFSGGLYALAIFGLFAAIVAAICVRETPVAVAQQPIGATAD
jgi:ACS family tartrate transporter-like MFS transporter